MANSSHDLFRLNPNGNVEKCVRCEACGHVYHYVVPQDRLDNTINFLVLDAAQAEGVDAEPARKKVERALAAFIEIVPCPNCGWYQRDMLQSVRDGYYPFAKFLAWGMLFLAMCISTIAFVTKDRVQHQLLPNWAWMVCGPLVGGGLMVLVLRNTIASREDPNAEPLEERLALGRERAV